MRVSIVLALLVAACRTKDAPDVDADGDGYLSADDCNDASAGANPGAAELCNGVDDNCNGLLDDGATDVSTFYADVDADGFGDVGASTTACALPGGYADDATDCDDHAADVFPGAAEEDCADDTDYNCDGSSGFADADGDGFAACQDCDDTASNVNADATEACDGVDNDCDKATDETGANGESVWYADQDGDGFGSPTDRVEGCEQPADYVGNADDCNDASAEAHAGAVETCDGLDNDCDGTADVGATDAGTWFVDADGDGYGAGTVSLVACKAPAGFVASSDDCDDGDAAAFPAAVEACDDADDDCDGEIDEGFDADDDGWTKCGGDCNDARADTSPDEDEVCNSRDDDCDGISDDSAIDAKVWYADVDGDGHGTTKFTVLSCNMPPGFSAFSDDCDDARGTVTPGAAEVCDSLDNDCDAQKDEGFDVDGDKFTGCGGDCNDAAVTTYPGATESCDGKDNDCDGVTDESGGAVWYVDYDKDGHGTSTISLTQCAQPTGFVAKNDDCDDVDPDYFTGAPLGCDGNDYNCDGNIDNDGDKDGYANGKCGGDDCNDADAKFVPEPGGGCALGRDCADVLAGGFSVGSGVYTIDPDGTNTGIAPFDAYCDMTTKGGGWTLCFSYDNATYDSANWPSISASRNKMLSQKWGATSLFGDGSRQGSFCSALTVNAASTELRAEVVRVVDSAVLTTGVYRVKEAGFFTQLHSNTTKEFDCLVDSTATKRLIYANYNSPASGMYNQPALTACSGVANDHRSLSLPSLSSSYGIDGLLTIANDASGAQADQELSLTVNWYGDWATNSLYVDNSVATQVKFGVNATWQPNAYGRSGATPGLHHCYTYCGHTNKIDNVFKQRLWLR